MNAKIKVLFDAHLLAENDTQSGIRSGIFFTALNLLKEFSKNQNVEIGIYCSKKNFSAKLIKTLQKYFPDNTFNNVFLEVLSPLELKKSELSCQYKEKKNFLTKIQLLGISALIKMQPAINYDSIINQYDVYFSPAMKMPKEILNNNNIKKFTLLHDIIPILFPQYFQNLNKNKYWLFQMTNQINKKNYYFANSEHTRQDYIKHIPNIHPDNITTTLLACYESFKPAKEKTVESLKKYNLPTDKKYIFSLCTLEPRKNLIRAVKTFIEFTKKNNINDMVFILGGGHWEGFIERMEAEVPDFDKYRNIILKAGYINDEDLAPLYSGAEWFVYTSEYEGFGLPPLEAMSCGCPVITSNNSSLPEVVGDAGIMIDFDSDEQHIKAYEKYYFDKEYRENNILKGLERTKAFSWKKCASKMIECMSKAAKQESAKI